MSLLEFQKILARLCVDSQFREIFWLDFEKMIKTYNLSAKEKQTLHALDRKQMIFYAKTLITKRFKKVEGAFELTYRVIGRKVMIRLFSVYCQLNLANNFTRLEEIQNFGDFLAEELSSNLTLPKYLLDLVEYEAFYFSLSNKVLEDLDDEEL